MLKKLIAVLYCILLAGCAAEKMRPVALDKLPDISIQTAPKLLIPTQAELLEKQSLEERDALTNFINTHHASMIETAQSMQFPFGRGVPKVSCLPLHACDIALQHGEKVTGIYPGDTVRWLFEQALSGSDQAHVIFKPKEMAINTNVIITTSRRTYHLDLIAKPEALVKSIAFYYPDDFLQAWDNLKNAAKETEKEEEAEQIENTAAFNHLNFNYRIEIPLLGTKPRWTPVRVFNNGKQVYVQMPNAAETIALPAFFVLSQDGELESVNYRIRKPYYIVDQLFKKAILVSGVDKNQQRVTITYDNH